MVPYFYKLKRIITFLIAVHHNYLSQWSIHLWVTKPAVLLHCLIFLLYFSWNTSITALGNSRGYVQLSLQQKQLLSNFRHFSPLNKWTQDLLVELIYHSLLVSGVTRNIAILSSLASIMKCAFLYWKVIKTRTTSQWWIGKLFFFCLFWYKFVDHLFSIFQ